MKKLIVVIFFLSAQVALSQLTLSEKAQLSSNQLFQSRVHLALFAKANYWTSQSVTNLQTQKCVNYARAFLRGAAFDLQAAVRTWLVNYNTAPVLDTNGQPTDSQILDLVALDVVFNGLSGVQAGDHLLPAN